MIRQIRTLAKIELCNLYGLNILRNTSDSKFKKKSIAMMAVALIVAVILMGYVAGLCYGLIILDISDIIPAYLITISSLLTLAFGVFKAGGVIFRKNGYEIISSLPLSDAAVVISRLIRLYIEDIVLTVGVMLPGVVVYAVLVQPKLTFYVVGLLSVPVIPLLPLTVAVGIGTLITGISSRMKHKALVEAALSVLLVVGIFAGSAGFSGNANNMLVQPGLEPGSGLDSEMTLEMIGKMSPVVMEILENIYPPAVILGNAMLQGDFAGFLLIALISAAAVIAVATVVAVNFHGISHRLYKTLAKHNYRLEHLQKNSVLKSLVKREAKRYFASGTYLTNTIIGPIMAAVLSVGLIFANLEKMTETFTISINVNAAVPFVVAGILVMMNAASVSISMEGKEWWIVKTLPLTVKNVVDGKIVFNLCLLTPFYVISEFGMLIALRTDIIGAFWIIVVPALIMAFSCVFGVNANLMFPKLDWDSEVSVVKQSAAALIGGMGGTLTAILCALMVLILPKAYTNLINLIIVIVLIILIMLLYHKNCKTDFKNV